jgi:hypothetical protein
MPTVGVLWPNPPDQLEFIRQPLAELGYVEGKNIRFEIRWEGALIAYLNWRKSLSVFRLISS